MTLDEFFHIAEASEEQAIAVLAAHPGLAQACEVAGDYQEGQASPAIIHAAHRGLSRLVAALLDAGADIESRGLGGGTALHAASWMGHSATVKVLLERGATVDLRCQAFGATPLGWAAHGFGPEGSYPKNDHVGAAQLLLAAGADPQLANSSNNRPIDLVTDPPDNPMWQVLQEHSH